ncbi:MAG: type II toxin-antitoxin system HicB family antitoxin [Thermoanaerobaculia bacterium]
MTVYIALLRKDQTSDYGVDFPDFPGCVSAGATVEEAAALAREALSLHIEGMIEDDAEIPEPSTLEAVLSDRRNRKAIPLLVPVDVPGKPVRVNVIVPSRDLKAIDSYAKRHGMSRSGFLVAAARQAMG